MGLPSHAKKTKIRALTNFSNSNICCRYFSRLLHNCLQF